MRKFVPALCMIGLLAGAALGCIDHQGQLAIFLTDDSGFAGAQSTVVGVQQVNVEISEVAIRHAETGQYLTLAGGSRVYELVGLQGRLSLLALADTLDESTYDAVRLTFSESNSNVITEAGRKQTLAIEPRVVVVPVLFRIVRDLEATLTLSLDSSASVAQKGNGSWVLRPVVRANSAS